MVWKKKKKSFVDRAEAGGTDLVVEDIDEGRV